MNLPIKSLMATAVAALCLGVGAVRADVVYVDSYPALGTAQFRTESGSTVEITSTGVGSTGNPDPRLTLGMMSFSIEPQQAVSAEATGAGDSTYTTAFVVMPTLVQRLFDLAFDRSAQRPGGYLAFALALQELILETSGSLSLSSGSYIRIGPSGDAATAVTDAEALLAEVQSAPDPSFHKNIVAFTSPSSQDFLTAIGGNIPPKHLPEPSGLALLAAALAAAGAVSRRRKPG